ncbi:MAG: hypothetical protein R6V04_01655 [bacterium]
MEKRKMKKRRIAAKESLPFSPTNYLLFGIGLFVIIIGYILLSIGPWNSFYSLTAAPIFLVIGYCIIIPVAILYHKKKNAQKGD